MIRCLVWFIGEWGVAVLVGDRCTFAISTKKARKSIVIELEKRHGWIMTGRTDGANYSLRRQAGNQVSSQ